MQLSGFSMYAHSDSVSISQVEGASAVLEYVNVSTLKTRSQSMSAVSEKLDAEVYNEIGSVVRPAESDLGEREVLQRER